MHQNTFLITPDVKKLFFKDLILVVLKYEQKHKNTFWIGSLEMHQNTFLTTPEVNKIIFLGLDSGGLEVCANA
jgi:hypothetical protein